MFLAHLFCNFSQMENQHIQIYQRGDQVICWMGDQQSRVEGAGNTVLEALTELSSNMESMLYSNHYKSDFLLEQLLALSSAMAAYNHPNLEKL